jgi:hypothetical protein
MVRSMMQPGMAIALGRLEQARVWARVHGPSRLVLAVLLASLITDLSILSTQYVHGGAYTTKGFYQSDWLMFYHAAERQRAGGNPYTAAGEFRNPPSFLLLARLALVLPYIPSRLIWSLASIGMLLAICPLLASALDVVLPRRTFFLLVGAVLLYPPTVLLVPLAANASAPAVLAYGLALWLFRAERDGWAGAALTPALLIKPQLLFLTVPLLLYKRRWRAACTCLAICAAGLVLSLLALGPGTFGDFVQMERATAAMANTLPLWIEDNPSIRAALLQLWPASTIANLASYAIGAALVAALAWYWRGPWQPRSPRFVLGWTMIPLVDLLVVPYAHTDDLVLVLLPALVLYVLRGAVDIRYHAIGWWGTAVLIALYLGPVLVLFFRQHFMVPAMLAALTVLWQSAGSQANSWGQSTG